jgi:hypothetical protein
MDLKQIKLSLAVVINLLAALTFGYFCFLGLNFKTLGDKSESILYAVIITLILIGTSLGAKFLKQTKRNFKSHRIWEAVLLVLFTLLTATFTYYPFSHYFLVSAQKPTIQKKLNENISKAENMYTEYESYVLKRDTDYLRSLNDAVNQKKIAPSVYFAFGFNDSSGVLPQTQLNIKHNTLIPLLKPTNFNAMKTIDSVWFAKARISVNDWEPISLVDVINNIKTNTNNSITKLIGFSRNRAKNETRIIFIPNLSEFNNVNNYFTTISTPSPFSIVLAFFSYLLMLLSWFITKRDSRSTGALTTAEYEIVL